MLLNIQESILARQANPWLPNANEEEEGRLNQPSNEDDPLFDHLIGYSLEEIENMSFRDLETTLVDSDVLPQPSSPPGVQVISGIFWKIPLVKFA